MFDILIEEIYKTFKSKMESGAYVMPEGLIYSFSKDVYNSFFIPKQIEIQRSASTNNLTTFQKQLFDLYQKTHQKFVVSSAMLFFTVYNLKADDLHNFIDTYEIIKKNEKRNVEEQKRLQEEATKKRVLQEQKIINDKIKNEEMIIEFDGIEKVKNIKLIFLGGSVEQIEFQYYTVPLSVYLCFDDNETPFVPGNLQSMGFDEINMDNVPEEIQELYLNIKNQFEDNEFIDSMFCSVIPENRFQDFNLFDIDLEFYEDINEKEKTIIKNDALNSINRINKKNPILKEIQIKELEAYLPNCDPDNYKGGRYGDGYHFNCSRGLNYLKKNMYEFIHTDLENVYILQPQLMSGALGDIDEGGALYLTLREPNINKNLFQYLNNHPVECFDLEGFDTYTFMINEEGSIISIGLSNEIDWFGPPIPIYTYVPLNEKFREIKGLSNKWKQYNDLYIVKIGKNKFKFIKETKTIEKIYGVVTTLEIPKQINESIVTTIGESAFSSIELKNVTIPEGVTTIEGNAFYNNHLTQVIIPESVITIKDNAFAGNGSLTEIRILGDQFRFNEKWTNIGFPINLIPTQKKAESFNRSVEVQEIDHSRFIPNILQGKQIVVTGTLKHFTRKDIKDTISNLGGKVQSNVTNKTNYVIKGFENTGTKLDEAKEKNVLILEEDEFLEKIIQGKPNQSINQNGDIKDKLKILKELYEEGLINEEDFNERKKEILKSI